jgi:hypothetical protein
LEIPSFEAIQVEGRRWLDETANIRLHGETHRCQRSNESVPPAGRFKVYRPDGRVLRFQGVIFKISFAATRRKVGRHEARIEG